MSCGVGCRYHLDLALLWLWHRPVATVPIGPLVWEPPHATGAALKRHTHTHTKTPQRCNIKHQYVLYQNIQIEAVESNWARGDSSGRGGQGSISAEETSIRGLKDVQGELCAYRTGQRGSWGSRRPEADGARQRTKKEPASRRSRCEKR